MTETHSGALVFFGATGDLATPAFEYEPGTWGPREVESLPPFGGWHNPTVADKA